MSMILKTHLIKKYFRTNLKQSYAPTWLLPTNKSSVPILPFLFPD